MKIGELANAAGCSVETIRYYEKIGLLAPPARSVNNYRLYPASHLDRLRFVRNCRALDMAHDEIRTLLSLLDQPSEDCGGINRVLDEHIGHVDARICELQDLRLQLTQLRARCLNGRPVEDCGIVQGLSEMEASVASTRRTHLG